MIVILGAFLGGFVTWLHGRGLIPRWLSQLLWCVPFFLAGGLLGCILSFLGLATGHGNGQDLGTFQGETKPEKIEYLILWAKKYLSPYWYDVLFMALWGIGTVSGGFLILSFPSAMILIGGGALCAVGYMIGWKLYPKNENSLATETGEFLTGFFGYGALFLALNIK